MKWIWKFSLQSGGHCVSPQFGNKNPSYQFVGIIFTPVLAGSSSLSGVPDYFGRNKISSGGDLSHYSRASLY